MTPAETLAMARQLLDRPDAKTAGLWPRLGGGGLTRLWLCAADSRNRQYAQARGRVECHSSVDFGPTLIRR